MMKCNLDNLQLYLWNELDQTLRQETEEHLKQCAACREELDELKLVYNMVADSKPVPELPDSEKIWEKVFEKPVVKRKFHVISGSFLLKVAALFLVFAAGLTVGNMNRNEVRPLPVEKPELMSRLDSYFSDVQPLMVSLANDVQLDEEERATGLIIELLNKNRTLQQLMGGKEDPYINNLLCDLEIILMDLGKIAESRRCSVGKKKVDYEDVVMKLNMFSVKL